MDPGVGQRERSGRSRVDRASAAERDGCGIGYARAGEAIATARLHYIARSSAAISTVAKLQNVSQTA